MFLTQEKVLKKVHQDRSKGDYKRAQQRAIEALEKWPDDYDLATEAVLACFENSDFHQAVSILKAALKRHPKNRARILDIAREQSMTSFNPFLGSFIIEVMVRGRNIEGAADIIRRSPESFVRDLITRCETRSKGLQQENTGTLSLAIDNELLLGLLYIEQKQYDKAVKPLGTVLEWSTEDAQLIGSLLVQLERERPNNADIKYYLGLASSLLKHYDKAEVRFFQCLELENPPLDKLLSSVVVFTDKTDNLLLLEGEILIRSGRAREGIDRIREYLGTGASGADNAPASDAASASGAASGGAASGGAASGGAERTGTSGSPATAPIASNIQCRCSRISNRHEFVLNRLSLLKGEAFCFVEVALLFCDVAVALDRLPEAHEALERISCSNDVCTGDVISWIERNESVSMTAPANKLLASLYIKTRNYQKAIEAARRAAGTNPAVIPPLIEVLERALDDPSCDDSDLRVGLAELHARAGNAERAEEVLNYLHEKESIGHEELCRLAGEILQHCGVTLGSVVSAIDIGVRGGDVSVAVRHLVEFCRQHQDADHELASEIRQIAEKRDNGWSLISQLLDAAAQEGNLPKHLRLLQAHAHLHTGKAERAVFEYDQMLMLDDHLRGNLVTVYEEAIERYPHNATLRLALYQLYLEEQQFQQAAHHLCKVLESDPGQIKDVLSRFNALVEKEPANTGIWEELIKTALTINHVNLAKDTLKRAVATLPREDAAALHAYGARISSADGRPQDSLKCIAIALTSQHANLVLVEEEIEALITRDPENPGARYLLGETLLRLGRERDAVSAFKRCFGVAPTYGNKVFSRFEKLLPSSVEPWLISHVLGEIAWEQGHAENALKYFSLAQNAPKEFIPTLGRTIEKLMESHGGDEKIALLYARNLSLESRYGEAVDLLEKLAAESAGLTRPVIDVLIELLRDAPGHLDANRLYARLVIRCQDPDRSLDPVLRMLADRERTPQELDQIIAEFLPYHTDRSEFHIPYGRLKAQTGQYEEALRRFKRALESAPGTWETIARETTGIAWPDTLSDPSRLLTVDCLLAGGNLDAAFEQLRKLDPAEPSLVEEAIHRMMMLIDRSHKKEHYSFGSSLLVRSGAMERARELINGACLVLDHGDCTDLKIELAEALHNAGEIKTSLAVFDEVLSGTGDRPAVLKRIEKVSAEWAAREVSERIERFSRGSRDDVLPTVHLAIEHGMYGSALEALSRSTAGGKSRTALLARIYLYMDRPALARAVATSVEREDDTGDDTNLELLYLEGIASERLSEWGRAASTFITIIGRRGSYLDSRCRAERNYTKFIESQFDECPMVIEKTTTATTDFCKGVETP